MEQLNLPPYKFNIKKKDNKLLIFDDIRRKFCVLTPEEWVRQNIIRYLIEEKKFPAGLVSVEAEISVNNLRRRYDGCIFGKDNKPLILIECKAPMVKITQAVFDQIFAYNTQIISPYMLVTNGLEHYFISCKENTQVTFLPEIPKYSKLTY